MNYKVSVITPSFNQGQFIEETILSVLNQTYSDIEYMVIDGGSSDSSKNIIEKYSSSIDYWVSEKDKGQADAINKGLRRATGDLVCWVNSDDILYPNFISDRVKQFAMNKDIDFIYGDVDQGFDFSNKSLRRGSSSTYKKMLLTLRVPIPQQSTMWRRDLTYKIGYLDIQWRVVLDWEYFLRIAKNSNIMYIPGSVAFFRYQNDSKSIKEKILWKDELIMLYSQIFKNSKLSFFSKRIAYANLYLYINTLLGRFISFQFFVKAFYFSPILAIKYFIKRCYKFVI